VLCSAPKITNSRQSQGKVKEITNQPLQSSLAREGKGKARRKLTKKISQNFLQNNRDTTITHH
jgi:hypothetical protein